MTVAVSFGVKRKRKTNSSVSSTNLYISWQTAEAKKSETGKKKKSAWT